MNTVRAKFTVQVVTPLDGGGAKVQLSPVTTGSAENEQFYKLTPGGEITLSTVNENAAAYFTAGQAYYVDFTLASVPAAAEAPAEAATAQAE